MLPTPEKPLTLMWVNNTDRTRSILSLKNGRKPIVDRGGRLRFIVNPNTQRFMRSMERSLDDQWRRAGFQTIHMPMRVNAYCQVVKYVTSDEVVPVSDLDNQWTTVQEMLQNGLILEDDKQLKSFFVEEKLTNSRNTQYAKCWLWVDDKTSVFVQYARMFAAERPIKFSTADVLILSSIFQSQLTIDKEDTQYIPSLLDEILNGEE